MRLQLTLLAVLATSALAAPPACTNGRTMCPGGGCFNLKIDPYNCGACGNECNSGTSCQSGKCRTNPCTDGTHNTPDGQCFTVTCGSGDGGQVMEIKRGVNVLDCADKCSEEEGCVGVNFAINQSQCVLYSTNTEVLTENASFDMARAGC